MNDGSRVIAELTLQAIFSVAFLWFGMWLGRWMERRHWQTSLGANDPFGVRQKHREEIRELECLYDGEQLR